MTVTPAVPEPLRAELAQRRERLWAVCGGEPAALRNPVHRAEAERVLACSRFVADTLTAHPALLADLAASSLWRAYPPGYLDSALARALAAVNDEAALLTALRAFRRREMVRIVWRDLARTADLEETLRDMTALAEACIRQTLDWWHPRLAAEWGEPLAADGTPQRLLVLAMGKLGAGELNVSSDIDLIFAYPEGGETRGGRRSLDNQEFFIRLGRKLIQALDNHTADGQVFRVDMRLRPWGQSGALALSFAAMEEYYQSQGREWERYAMVKARPVAGRAGDAEALMALLRPFTYRRYIDFSVIESLRDMKRMIEREVRRKGMEGNIKLGPGGIREIEFVVQSFQLIRGGQEPALRERYLLQVLAWLGAQQLLPPTAVAELDAAYRFLRNVEHAIQGWEDRQTQMLPDEPLAQAAMAFSLGFADWAAFSAKLQTHRQAVQGHFAAVVAGPEDSEADNDSRLPPWMALWRGELGEEAAAECLAAFTDPAWVMQQLTALREGSAVRLVQAVGRERLDRFMPVLLTAIADTAQPDELLRRLLPLVEAVLRRTAYLVLLLENPAALAQLIRLCAASPWIADQLARHPALLDELLDPRTLYRLPDRAQIGQQLTEHMLRVPPDDLEQQMDGLRYFRLAYGLRIAACEVVGVLPLMQVSDQLTWLAEALLSYTLDRVWADLEHRHGLPGGLRSDDPRPFVVIGYGKLGGLELGHGSDLDLVFLYDAPASAVSAGERALDNTSFFTRLGQRIIHVLTAQTTLGKLYEVDMRLRPSGASGLLVSTVEAFEAYQRTQAWTWEHQALVRARVVAGSPRLAQRFAAIRQEVLCRPREATALRRDVCLMRQKMRDHLLPAAERQPPEAGFSLKQGVGGIVDIEFMMQYAVLAWAHRYPSLAEFTDNIRILEAVAREGLLDAEAAGALRAAWLAYREAQHRLALQALPGRVPADSCAGHRAAVQRQWQAWLDAGNDPTHHTTQDSDPAGPSGVLNDVDG